MGSATAYALARQGRAVVLLERFEVGHRRGSSHGTSRIFRLSYPEASYVAMAQEALALWRNVEARCGRRLLVTTGGVDTGKALDQHVDALAASGAPFQMLDGREASARYGLRLPAHDPVLFQPDAGFALADEAWRSFIAEAVASGATSCEHTPVRALDAHDDRVLIRTNEEVLSARAVVVTAGAWARPLVAGAGIALPTVPTRETVAYFSVSDDRPVPAVVDWGEPSVYALSAPGFGIKVGEHHAGPVIDPDTEGEVDAASVERLSAWVAQRFPKANPRPIYAETCLYTNAPEERFILERHGRVVVGSACSGHGFKFAPLIGERLAALATEAADA